MTSLETLEGLWRTRPGGLAFAAYAESLENAGRRDEAEQILADGVGRWPRHLAGWILRGRIAQGKGDLETARVAFQTATEIDNNSRAALNGLADVCTHQQYLKLAFETWNRLAILDPDNSLAAESARKVASRMDSPGTSDSFIPVREQEDVLSREALNEGTSSQAIFTTASPGSGTLADFDLNLGDVPSSSALATTGFSRPIAGDLPDFEAPDLSFTPLLVPAPEAIAPPSGSPSTISHASLGKFEESGFATLEMPSFPNKTIPPPPLEIPKVQAAEPSAPQAHSLLNPSIPNPFSISEERLQMAEATQMMPTPPKVGGRVTGDDIEDRLDEVFGSSSLPMPPSVPPISTEPGLSGMIAPAASETNQGSVTGDDVEDRLGELFGETGEMPFAVPEPALVREPARTGQPVVSGSDIEGRLDDLFGESVIDLTSPVESVLGDTIDDPEQHSADTSVFMRAAGSAKSFLDKDAGDTSALANETETSADVRDPITDKLVLERKPGLESTTEFNRGSLNLDPHRMVDLASKGSEIDPAGSTIDLPTIEFPSSREGDASPRLTGDDVDSRLDELFASSEFLVDPPGASAGGKTGFVPRPVKAGPEGVTGDDIEGRLDDLFGGDSDFPASLPTVTFAEEYLRQGHKEKGISIYRQLLDRDPKNNDLRRRLDELEGRS